MSEGDDAGNDDDDIVPINMRTLHITFTHSKADKTSVPFFFSLLLLLLVAHPTSKQPNYGTSLLLLYHTQHNMRDVCLCFCITHEWRIPCTL